MCKELYYETEGDCIFGGTGGIVPIVKNHLLTQSINRKGSMALPITQMQD